MKKLIIVTLITTCAALCAAVVPSRFMRKIVLQAPAE